MIIHSFIPDISIGPLHVLLLYCNHCYLWQLYLRCVLLVTAWIICEEPLTS